jgi:hypothetical protein
MYPCRYQPRRNPVGGIQQRQHPIRNIWNQQATVDSNRKLYIVDFGRQATKLGANNTRLDFEVKRFLKISIA